MNSALEARDDFPVAGTDNTSVSELAGGKRKKNSMKNWMKKAALVAVTAGSVVAAHAQADANVSAVNSGVTTLTSVFAGVFGLGVAVVIAMVAKKYLRRAS
jgi:hypothetical protein